jgi:hypothetical protein
METTAMYIDRNFSSEKPHGASEVRSGWLAWIGAWISACRDYYAAAAAYDELRRLSDAELARRGLNRETLARDLCERSEKASDR